jgi:alkanesulfonate monooxygenase SsuD/methylene tetrahydromethanopterin reductase-like flavin-dependent oxidoreductase (luciferase family)
MPSDKRLSIGVMLPTHAPRGVPLEPQFIAEIAVWAEDRGFDAVWAGDHIVHPWQFLESLTSLTFVAARTRTIALGTCVLLLPMRQLSIAAAQIATLATLSDGRLRLGIGVGGEWPGEWQAAGVPIKERGHRLDEALPLLRQLLRGEKIDFSGRFHDFAGVSLSPSPPPIPIYLAGRAPAALARIGRLADGWLGFFLTPKGFQRDGALIDTARVQAGRSDCPFERGMLLNFHFSTDANTALETALALNLGFAQEIRLAASSEQLRLFALAGTPATVLRRLREYVDAGCTTFCVAPMQKDRIAYQAQMDIFAKEVLPKLRQQGLPR